MFGDAVEFGAGMLLCTGLIYLLVALFRPRMDWPKWLPLVAALAAGVIVILTKGGWELLSYQLNSDSPMPLEFDAVDQWELIKGGILGGIAGIVGAWWFSIGRFD